MVNWSSHFESALPYDKFLDQYATSSQRARWDAMHARFAAWSPDGRTIVFAGGTVSFDEVDLYVVAATGGTQVALPAGSTGILVRVDSSEDALDENDETFTLSVASVVSGTVGSTADTGLGTITDDDAAPGLRGELSRTMRENLRARDPKPEPP